MSIKVRLKGKDYWFINDSFDEDGAIAPLEHCDDKGDPIVFEESFAHYFPGQGIVRYGEKIGDLEDLKIIT